MLIAFLLALGGGDEVRSGVPFVARLSGPDERAHLRLFAAGEFTLSVESLDFDVSAEVSSASGAPIPPRHRWQVAGDEHLVYSLPDTGPFRLQIASEDDDGGEFEVFVSPVAILKPDSEALDLAQIEHWRAAAERALSRGNPARATELFWSAAERRWRRDEPEATRDLLYRMLDVPGATESLPYGPLARAHLGLCELRLGSPEVALPMLESAAQELEQLHLPDRCIDLRSALAEVHIGARKFDRAAAELERAVEAFAELDPVERPTYAHVFEHLAQVRQDVPPVSSEGVAAGFAHAVAEIERRLAPVSDGVPPSPPALPADLVPRLQAALGPKRALVLFADGRKELYVYGLTSSKSIRSSAGDRAEIAEVVRGYVGDLSRPDGGGAETAEHGATLYRRLLEPLLRELGSRPEACVFVPTRELAPLPFEALVVSSGDAPRYLIDDLRCDVGPTPLLLVGELATAGEGPPVVELRPAPDAGEVLALAASALREGRRAAFIDAWPSPELRKLCLERFTAGAAPLDALHAARLELRAKPETRSPHHWAGLRAFGSGR